MKIGHGVDIHAFGGKKPLILGGVVISNDIGVIAHSDGDVLLHAISNALLGAMSFGDIGTFFPSNDMSIKDISSKEILKYVLRKVIQQKYQISNIDSTLIIEYPNMSKYISKIRYSISSILSINIDNVSVKATSSEKIGFVGRNEGIVCMSVALLSRK